MSTARIPWHRCNRGSLEIQAAAGGAWTPLEDVKLVGLVFDYSVTFSQTTHDKSASYTVQFLPSEYAFDGIEIADRELKITLKLIHFTNFLQRYLFMIQW